MKIVFLSFPKVAGTAIRNSIIRNNPGLRRLPAWDMSQACRHSVAELNRYDLFAGHFDWSFLDCLEGDRFVFTVLRPPFERVVSQYFYLREKATKAIANGAVLSPKNLPANHLIYTLPPLEYLNMEDIQWRDAIRDLFDNLYMHYFFFRGYRGQRNARESKLPKTRVLEIALQNLSRLDYIATFDNLDRDLREIEHLTGTRFVHDLAVEHRTAFGVGRSKRDLVMELEPSGRLLQQFDEFSGFDSLIYETVSTRKPQPRQLNEVGA